ncbi:metallophosphoesterase [Stieleria sp. JC731]|uniref:metallophosphoesterase family protein n=1 Tax=Pirellulaceae TaxID=2691357 RepID=UPI001E39DB72|nr:metallophosphoesterase [Stieleria sp. JC731]MCC9604104.1 metallophosphoesterase [Stieleria sp. JC731]
MTNPPTVFTGRGQSAVGPAASVQLAWSSDIHLNHANFAAWDRWVAMHQRSELSGLLITGDLSEAEDVYFQLSRIAEEFNLPIYFVLGNHDYYGSSVAATRRMVTSMTRNQPSLVYLTDSAPLEITRNCYLVGDDGWGDATVGDYDNSPVRLNDFALIEDFYKIDPVNWRAKLSELGGDSASRLESKLRSIPPSAEVVHVATHVPPFREACWYNGQTTDDDWAPFFVCGHIGEVLRSFAEERPDAQVRVYCGHTHSCGVAKVRENLVVYTAGADYGEPKVERVISV